MGTSNNARLIAVRILVDVHEHGRSLSVACNQRLPSLSDPRDRGFCQQLVYGASRWQLQLDAIIQKLTRKKIKDADIYWVVLLGLYQLQHTRVPAYAAISESVQASRALKKNWASGLINGVLRNFQRQQTKLIDELQANHEAHYSHPAWFIQQLQSDWPHDWQTILEQNNQQGPMTLRVNVLTTNREHYLEKLAEAGIQAQPHAAVASAIILDSPVDVGSLPGFADGQVSVQDAAAQLAAELLQAGSGHRVLDACAAPGGKTCHILEKYPDIDSVTALEIDESRLERISENLFRLGLSAHIEAGDAAKPADWWDNQPFDRILLDAPCSATGVIRRHPDIKKLRTEADIFSLSKQQSALLLALWPLLKPGGLLLYATCSILPQENEQRIAAFLKVTEDAIEVPITPGKESNWGRSSKHGRQLLPGEADMDGFFYSLLQKQS